MGDRPNRRGSRGNHEGPSRAEARANVLDALQAVLTPDEEVAGGTPSDGTTDSLTLTFAA